jgi:hypothetical protein
VGQISDLPSPATKKTSRIHGTIQRTTRMLVFVARPDALVEFGHSSPPLPFSLRRVNAVTSSTSHPAGAGISERSFARPQQRFRHHCGVNAPDLRLRFHTTNSRESVRLSTPPLRSVSRPTQGEILAKSPFPAPICGALAASPASTPLRAFLQTLRIKAFDRFRHQKLISRNARLSLAKA